MGTLHIVGVAGDPSVALHRARKSVETIAKTIGNDPMRRIQTVAIAREYPGGRNEPSFTSTSPAA